MIHVRSMVLALVCAGALCMGMLPGGAGAAEPPSAAVTVAPAWHWPDRPITSRAALDAYLRDTPAAASPLSAFSVPGRRRFLASLAFREHGLGGFATDDLQYDLTRAQAWAVLRLFGVEGYADDLAARSRPRPPDGQAATLEAAFDQLIALQSGSPGAGTLDALYARVFAPVQAHLAALGNRDLELLFRAALRRVGAGTYPPSLLADLHRDFAELERRHQVERPHANDYYNTLLAAHQPEQARAVLAANPLLERAPPPTLHGHAARRAGTTPVWVIQGGPRELWQLPLTLRAPAQLVVLGSPGCHFSTAAASAIDADPTLRELFRQHAQWVAPASDIADYDALAAWNRAHPAQRLVVLDTDAGLPFVKQMATPVFYFLRRGTVVAKVTGFQPEAVRSGLRQLGLLRPATTPGSSR